MLIIKDNLINKISYYHLLAFLLMLPFDQFYSELILISLIVHTLINISKELQAFAAITMIRRAEISGCS